MFEPAETPLDLEVLLLPEATLIALSAVIEPLRAATRLLGRRRYGWEITSPDGAAVVTAAGLAIPAARAFVPEGARPLVVVASYGIETQITPSLVRRVAAAGRHRPAVGAVESGVWLLARAGLLDGRRAAVHPEDADEFAARFAGIETVPDRWAIDGPRFTAAAASPALDLMLELIRRRDGAPLALEVSRLFGFARGGPMAPGPARLVAETPALAAAIRVMEAHLDEPLPVERIARLAGVSARHLLTLFRATLGVSPSAYYQALRLNRARQMLAETRSPALEVAAATGFASPAAFSRAYRRHHGESPRETRVRLGR